ncbi:MAG: hypothetical protein RI984_654 [Pseudomonadota bacterium]|jgi:hypothetical protein
MFKFIPSFQSFFIANQSQATALPSFMRANKQSEVSGRVKSQKLKQAISLQRMAREVESSQPNLAAELRNFASR